MKTSSVVVLIICEEKRSLVRVREEKLSQSGATTPTGCVTRHLFFFRYFVCFIFLFAKDCLLTLVKSGLALGSPLFVCSGVTLPKMAKYTE